MEDLGHNEALHDCRKNFYESAKSMEANVGIKLITKNDVLKSGGLNVHVIISDENKTSMATLEKRNLLTVNILAERNQ